MGRLTIVAGMPAAGKSTWLRTNKEKFDVVYDNFYASQPKRENVQSIDDNKDPLENSQLDAILNHLKAGRNIAVTDILFCIPRHRNSFLAVILNQCADTEFDFVFFSSNPEASKQNVKVRNRVDRLEKELQLIDMIHPRYSALTVETLATYDA